jgi:hypothetical protein
VQTLAAQGQLGGLAAAQMPPVLLNLDLKSQTLWPTGWHKVLRQGRFYPKTGLLMQKLAELCAGKNQMDPRESS